MNRSVCSIQLFALLLVALLAVGCDQPRGPAKAKTTEPKAVAKIDPVKPGTTTKGSSNAKNEPAKNEFPSLASKHKLPPATPNKPRERSSDGFSTRFQGRDGFGSINPTVGGGMNSGSISGGMGGDHAFDRIEAEIRAAATDNKALVVFVVDQAAAVKVNGLADRIGRMYAGGGNTSALSKNLLAAVVSYGDKVDVLTPEPITDGPQLTKLLNEVKGNSSPGKLTYQAVLAGAKQFASYRQRQYEVLFVVLANDAVADEVALKDAVALLKRNFIPVYATGKAEPFYEKNQKIEPGKPSGASWAVEHITLYTPARLNDENYIDSGFGNFGLERICRATDGKFFRTGGRSGTGWATEANGEVKSDLVRKYAPDYISEADYQAALKSNKARQALVEATKLVIDAAFEPPQLTFPGGDGDNQARINLALTGAQQKAAKPQIEIEKIVGVLQAGEADRAKLTSPRWQAAYDLALGRALGALARTLGYNKMLAQLKTGKTFMNKNSTTWELVPSDNFSNDSQLNTMAKKSREYLKRVVDNHPGTPWADIADKELQAQCGWDWTER